MEERLDAVVLHLDRDVRRVPRTYRLSFLHILSDHLTQVRSVFRIAEYAQGYFGYLATHEGYFYALDALPIFLCIACFTVFWPPIIFDHIDENHDYPLEVRTSSATSMEGILKA